ncbi:hypothetical protein Tco_0717160 [Tanacetum coccineum]
MAKGNGNVLIYLYVRLSASRGLKGVFEFPCLGVCRYLAEIIAINLDTSSDNSSSDSASTSHISTSEKIDYSSPECKGPSKSLLKWFGYLSDEYKDNDRFWVQREPSIASVSEEGPSIQGLLDWYGYNIVEEYLSDTYFPSTYKDNTDKDNTDEDTIYESYSPMSKGKYGPVSHQNNPKVKNPIPVTGCVLGLANVTTWDEILKKIRMKVFLGSLHLHLAFAACICILHLQLAFASCICKQAIAACIYSLQLQLAFAACICILHLQLAFAACICILHLQASICRLLTLQQALAATKLTHLLAIATTNVLTISLHLQQPT